MSADDIRCTVDDVLYITFTKLAAAISSHHPALYPHLTRKLTSSNFGGVVVDCSAERSDRVSKFSHTAVQKIWLFFPGDMQ